MSTHTTMITINLCQGEASEHIAMIGDGKSGKTFKARQLLQKLPSTFKIWVYDYNHNGFKGIGTPVRSLNDLIDANVQYLPQEKTREEMNKFLEIALRLGNRVVVLDEFHTQQNSKGIPPTTERFLKTARHHNISWIVIAQSPLELHESVYHNQDHIYAFFMDTANRHIKWYYDWFGKQMTGQLIQAHAVAIENNLPRPFIYKRKGMSPKLYRPGQK